MTVLRSTEGGQAMRGTGRRNRWADLFSDLAVLALMLLPFFMVLSRGISPVALAHVFGYLLVATVISGQFATLLRSLPKLSTEPLSLLAILFVFYLAISLLWSPAPSRGAQLLLHTVAVFTCLFLTVAALRLRRSPPRLGARTLAACLLLAIATLIVELVFQSPIRGFLSPSTEAFRLNRSVIALVLFLPIAMHALLRSGDLFLAFAVGIGTTVVVFLSESESAKLALIIVWILAIAQTISRQVALTALGLVVFSSLLFIPLVAPYLNDLFPDSIHDLVGRGSMQERGEIWAGFAQLIPNALVFGHGIEASFMAREIWDSQLSPHSIHPHNVALQIWFELGLVGICLATAGLTLLFSRLWKMPERTRDPLVLFTGAVWAVTFVSHGAWQAWWWCLVGGVVVYMLSDMQATVENR